MDGNLEDRIRQSGIKALVAMGISREEAESEASRCVRIYKDVATFEGIDHDTYFRRVLEDMGESVEV